jgi:predicted esterase
MRPIGVALAGKNSFLSGDRMLKTEFYEAAEKNSRHLLVMMHGLGDSTEGYRWVPSMMRLPWLNYLLVNAPDPYFGGWSWYDFAGDAAPGILRSRKMLFELLDHFRDKGFPTGQTIVSGFSQGCLMTWEAGLYYPHRFAGLVGISGYAFQAEHHAGWLSPVAKEQRFLMTHGRFDQLVPFAEVKKQVEELKSLGLQIEWREFDKAHTIDNEEVDVIREFIRKCSGK